MVVSNGIKDTNLKANHNSFRKRYVPFTVVSNGIKDTNLKANHNQDIRPTGNGELFPMVQRY